jgi:hypothetical protein
MSIGKLMDKENVVDKAERYRFVILALRKLKHEDLSFKASQGCRVRPSPNKKKKKKENVVYTYNWILFSLKKKDILQYEATWMNWEDIILCEISQSSTKGNGIVFYFLKFCLFIVYYVEKL